MSILTIPAAMLRRLVGNLHADTSADAELGYVLADEQPAIEYALDADALAASLSDAGLSAVLVLGVASLVAGSYLQQIGRAPGALDDVSLYGLSITPSKTHDSVALGVLLQTQGASRLAPYLARPSASATVGVVPAGLSLGLGAAGSVAATTPTSAPGDGVTSGAIITSTEGASLFGGEQPGALGTDDSDPPNEFSTGFSSVSDSDGIEGDA